MTRFKVAFIGAGFMADEHCKAFSDIPEVAILGIHSRTKQQAEVIAQKHGILQVYDSIDSLYAGTKADLVVIAVPELSANMVCKAAFQYPWQALIEKPAGFNLSDAQDIADSADYFNFKAYVALNRRHYSSTCSVLEELASVEGQRLVQVFDQENPQVAFDSGQPELVIQNWMYANSIHLIDYFCTFCRGDLTTAQHVIKWNPLDPRFVFSKLHYSSGDIGIYQAIWNGPGPWGVSISTQAKHWEMRPLEQATSLVYKSRKREPLPVHLWDTSFKPGLRRQAEETLKALRGEPNNLPTLTDGIATMQLINQIYES